MLEVRLLGQFDVRLDGEPVEIPSRPAQSLLAYLILSAGTAHRREKLAGLLWPDLPESNTRNNLRQALWRIRQAIETNGQSRRNYLLADNITIAFDADAQYWLDADILNREMADEWLTNDLVAALSAYRGELLPGFYDEWIVLERERLQAVFERKMQMLLNRLVEEQHWSEVLEWGERWIALGSAPEPAYRALMMAHSGLGDLSSMAIAFQRCVEALRDELGVEASEQTRVYYDRLVKGERPTGLLIETSPPRPTPFLIDEPPAPGDPPFKGLQYFDEVDADLFFGRELLTARLMGNLRDNRFLAVIVGASGSGKSSVVRAGLVPALKRGEPLADGTLPPEGSTGWLVHIITPTAHPLEALAASLTRDSESVTATATLMDDLARDPRSLHLAVKRATHLNGASHVLLVVDQFEELFTLCQDEATRKAFIDNLLTAAGAPVPVLREGWGGGLTTVVITLRADFYAHCAQYANLREALASHQEYIGPMSAEELRRAIEEPAKRGGWEFEPGLVDLLLRDAGDEPGALPLLSHALLETWLRRRGRALTLKGYAESGGVRGAIAKTAESVIQKLSPEQRSIARSIFLRLTELGEGTAAGDTRRRATLAELITHPEDAPGVETVLKTLVDARLITTSEGSAEVAHEALIREWPTLREWLAQDREGLRLHRHLTEAAQEWDALERDPGALYRGARLAQALEWAESHSRELNAPERDYLSASKRQADREQAEREAQRQRELAAAQQLAATEKRRAMEQARSNRRLKRLAIGLCVVLLVAIASTGLAIQQNNRAAAQARLAASRELTMAAIGNLEIDPQRSLLLALRAASETYTIDKTLLPETENILHRAIQAARFHVTLPYSDTVIGVDLSPECVSLPDTPTPECGMRAYTAYADGTLNVWDAPGGQQLGTLSTGHTDRINAVTFSPDGKRMATASADGTAKVWDAATSRLLFSLAAMGSGEQDIGGLFNGVLALEFSPDGKRLATASAEGTAKVWDAVTGEEHLTLTGHNGGLTDITFSPDGKRLATGGADATARVWDAATGRELLTLAGHGDRVWSVAFSPECVSPPDTPAERCGARLVTTGRDRTVKVWDAITGQELLELSGYNSMVVKSAFSPNGARLATGSADGSAKVWDISSDIAEEADRELFTLLGHTDLLYDIGFSPDGAHIATAGADGSVRVWDTSLGREMLTFFAGATYDFALSPNGARLATTGADGTARVWSATTGQALLTLSAPDSLQPLNRIAFSPDGSRLAAGSNDATAKIWDAANGKLLLDLVGHQDKVYGVAFSPDGKRIATSSADKTAKVWDAATGQDLLTLAGHDKSIWRVAYSPDGSHIATASDDGMARVWDAASGAQLLKLSGHFDWVWGLAFSPDGARLATGSFDRSAKVWDAATGEILVNLAGHANSIHSVAFSPDGTRLATASADGTTRVWNVATGEELLNLSGSVAVGGVAFSPDGARLVTSGLDGMLRVYVLPIDDLIALAQARLTRTWTQEECQKFLHVERCP